MAQNARISRFLTHGGPVGQKVRCKKVAHFRGETLGVSSFFPQKRPSQREIAFARFRPSPGIYLSAKGRPRPKWPEMPVFCDFLPVGVRSGKTEDVKKLRTTIPDSVVIFFLNFGAPSAGKFYFSVFSPRLGFLQVPKAALGSNGLKYPCCATSRPWGSGRPKRKM